MIGLLPVLPATVLPRRATRLGAALGKHFARFLENAGRHRRPAAAPRLDHDATDDNRLVLSLLPPAKLERVLREVFDESAFLSPYGLRALSAAASRRAVRGDHRGRDRDRRLRAGRIDDRPVRRELELARAGVVPGQLPVHRVAAALGRRAGRDVHGRVPDRLRAALTAARGRRASWRCGWSSIWLPDEDGKRPVYRGIERLENDPDWRDLLLFHEYFHGDTGAGIGASHQTGWTGLVAHLLCRGGVIDRATGAGTGGIGLSGSKAPESASPAADPSTARR